ncbi:multidrug MFS transporter [Desulfotomaculum copahuensis]|uniref:Multidrug MFS transporter n=2 Tax=Desulfotomaculum copahuensis TaxID=1838280 RepID=A0A1B7LAK7_9FIRM|nr:multidrug MFS transporter [Desulfotomaculum copahuensis]
MPAITRRAGYPWWVVGTVCVGAFMAALDASVINVAMPTFKAAFKENLGTVEWVSIAYLLTLTSMLTVFGHLADIVGRRTLYTLGFLVFIAGSALCGASPAIQWLIVFRVLQAVGAGMLQANSIAIVTAAAPGKSRGKAIGIQGSAQAVGLSVGPALGGWLIGHFGWRSIFYINVPVGVIGTLLAVMVLPRDRLVHHREKFDYLGGFLLTPALVALIIAFQKGYKLGWFSGIILSLILTWLTFSAAFIWWEGRVKHPMVDLGMFHNRIFTLGNITGLLSYAAMFGVLFLMPFYLEGVHGYPATLTGIFLTPVPLAMMVVAPVAGHLYDRYGARLLTVSGMTITAAGAGLLATLGMRTPFWLVVVYLALVGAGLGLFTPPNNTSVMSSVHHGRFGVAGGILNMARSLGMVLGVAFTGTIFSILQNVFVHLGLSKQVAVLHAFRYTFWGVLILALLAAVLSLGGKRDEKNSGDRREYEPTFEF